MSIHITRTLRDSIVIRAGRGITLTGTQNTRETWQDKTHCSCRFTIRLKQSCAKTSNQEAPASSFRWWYDRNEFTRFGIDSFSFKVDDQSALQYFRSLVYFTDRNGVRLADGPSYDVPFEIVDGNAVCYGCSLFDGLDGTTFQAVTNATSYIYGGLNRRDLRVVNNPQGKVYGAGWLENANTGEPIDMDDWISQTVETVTWRRVL